MNTLPHSRQLGSAINSPTVCLPLRASLAHVEATALRQQSSWIDRVTVFLLPGREQGRVLASTRNAKVKVRLSGQHVDSRQWDPFRLFERKRQGWTRCSNVAESLELSYTPVTRCLRRSSEKAAWRFLWSSKSTLSSKAISVLASRACSHNT